MAQKRNRIISWGNRDSLEAKNCEVTACYPLFSGETEGDYMKSSTDMWKILERGCLKSFVNIIK